MVIARAYGSDSWCFHSQLNGAESFSPWPHPGPLVAAHGTGGWESALVEQPVSETRS